MLRRVLGSFFLLSLSSCLFVPDNEATVTFQYILLHRDANNEIVALLCNEQNVGQIQPFLNARVSRLIVVGTSARGLTVLREADCFYQPNDDFINTPEELGQFSVTLPADTYTRLELRIFDQGGAPLVWANDPDDDFGESFNILGTESITVTPEGSQDLGNLFIRQGLTSQVVDKEIKIFPEFP